MADIGDAKQLIDVRDGKKYWIARLVDGNCWMTQNLDLDFVAGKELTSDTSDVRRSWDPGEIVWRKSGNQWQDVSTGWTPLRRPLREVALPTRVRHLSLSVPEAGICPLAAVVVVFTL